MACRKDLASLRYPASILLILIGFCRKDLASLRYPASILLILIGFGVLVWVLLPSRSPVPPRYGVSLLF